MTDQQARDLRSVAVHESAHAHVAIWFGDPAPDVRVDPTARGFRGMCWPSIALKNPGRRWCALAGAIAQIVLIDPGIAPQAAYYALLACDPIGLTEGDERAAGSFDQRDVAATMTLVRRLWPKITATAEVLAQHTAERICVAVA
jgi:hypothetical protein